MTIQDKLKVVPLAAFLLIPPEYASIQRDVLDAGYLYLSYTCWYDSISSSERPPSCCCGPSSLHASIVMLLESQMAVHPHTKPSSRFLVKYDKGVPNMYVCC